MDKGRNAGAEGIVDFVGSPQFGCKVMFWAENTGVSGTDNTGQGSNDLGDSLSLIENGTILLRAKVRRDLFPFPANLKNASGTVTFYLDKPASTSGQASLQMTATYRFDKVDFKYDEKTETLWDLTLGGDRISALTPSGFANNGSQPTTTARAPGNQYLYSGRSKVYDPSTVGPIIDGSVQRVNLWGVSADTDAAEVTAIGTILAAYVTPPQPREVVNTITCNRLSSSVLTFTINWKQLNAQRDIEVPAHIVSVDPRDLQSYAASSIVYALSSIIPTPVPPSGLKLAGQQQTQINEFLSVDRREYKKNDSQDAIELPGTVTSIDNSSLNSQAIIVKVDGTTSTLTGFSLRDTSTVQMTAAGTQHWATTTKFGLTTTAQDEIFPSEFTLLDPNSLNTMAMHTVISNNTAPTYSAPSGLKIVNSKVVQLTGSLGTNNQYKGVWELGTRDSADNATFPETFSTRGSDETFTDSVATLITTGTNGNIATHANLLWSQFQGTPYAKGLRLSPVTDGIRKLVQKYRNIGYLVRGTTRSGARQIQAQVSGGIVQLHIESAFYYTGTVGNPGRALIILSRVEDYSADIRDFILFRQIVGTTIPENSSSTINGITLPDIGQVNSGTFLGLAAGTVAYQGVKFKVNLGLTAAGNLSMLIGYSFHGNSLGIINGVPTSIYRRGLPRQFLSLPAPNSWVAATSLGYSDIVVPTNADFSAFNSLP